MEAQLFFVFIGLVFINIQLAAAQGGNVSLPSTIGLFVLPGGLNSCHSFQEREAVRNNITSIVHDLLLSLLPGSPVPECGEGNWVQIANLNMGDPSQQCPPQWREVSTPARSCGLATGGFSCDSVFYSVSVGEYSRVCGRMTGYFHRTPDGFHSGDETIDGPYVDGVSVTYGSPRNHIWTLAAGHTGRCPCDNPNRRTAPLPPSFVGDNYFCDTQGNGALWDGIDCTNNCCTFNSPPWFSVQLSTSTTDDIEVRICVNQPITDEDVPVGLIQLYIQ